MADESRNPQDEFRFRELQRALSENQAEISAIDRGLDELKAETRQEARKAEKRAATGERTAKAAARASARAQARGEAPPTPTEAKAIADDTERSALAARARADAVREEGRMLPVLASAERSRAQGAGFTIRSASESIRLSGERTKAAIAEAKANEELRRSEQFRRAQLQLPRASSIQLGPATAGGPSRRERGIGEEPRPLPRAKTGAFEDYRGTIGARQPPDAGPVVALTAADQKLVTQEQALARAAAQVERGNMAERRAIAETARTVGLSGDQFRRHGALTTEFIAAAAKGQVTIRELGYQVGSTIGKFAGWTAAATAVYGALGAVSALGTGALESQGGITQLSRVVSGINTDQAQQQFRDLSREFNLPIKDVAAAAYEAGRVFKDQNDIFAATRTTLGAVAVAELDAGQAGKYFNAIYRGLGGTAQDLAGTLDAANNITNKFGGNTGQLVQGTAGAAAAFRTASKAGEGYAELLAMINTITLATGQSGAEAGTIMRRGAQNIQRPKNRDALKALLQGVTDSSSITEIVRAAQKEVAKSTTTPQRATEIASQIFTPNLAAKGGLALLANPELMARMLGAAQPGARRDSVSREVEAKLRAVREQAKGVVIELGDLGSALAQSGALTALGGMLQLLTSSLHAATYLVEQFDKLPSGARTAIVAFAQLRGILAVIRRFDTGQALSGRFPTAAPFLRRDPRRLERAETLSGIGQHRTSVIDESNRVAKEARRNAFAQVAATERLATAQGTGDAARITAAEQRVGRLQSEGLDLAAEQEDLASQHRAVLHQENEYTRRTARLRRGAVEEQRAIARSLGIQYTNPTLDQRTYQRPIPLTQVIAGPARRGAGPGEVGTGAVAAVPITTIASQGETYQRAQNSLRGAIQEQNRVARSLAPGARNFATAANVAAGTLTFAGRATVNSVRGLRALGSSIIGSLGPLELLAASALAAYTAYEFINRQIAETNAAVDRLQTIRSESPAELRGQGQRELAHSSLMEKIQDAAFGALDTGLAGALIPGNLADRTPNALKNRAARDRIATARVIEESNRKGVDLTDQQIRDRLKKRLAGADAKQIAAAASDAAREATVGRTAIRGEGPAAVQALQDLRAFIRNAAREARAIAGETKGVVPTDTKGLLDYTGNLLPSQIGLRGRVTTGDVANARTAIANARRNAKKATTGKDLADALNVIQQAENDILQPAQEELDRLIRQAQNPAQQARARRRFARVVRRTYTGADAAKGRALIAEENRKQLDAELAAFDARSQRLQSETTDPVARAREAASSASQRLAKVRDAYRRHLVAIDVLDQAVAANNDALRALSDARVADAESRRRLATSQFSLTHFTDRGAMLRRALQDAQSKVDTIRAEGSQQSPEALRDAIANVNAARQAIAEDARSQAQELLAANAELAKARTDDPVRQAEIDAGLARDQERFATTRAERRSARARTIAARKNVIAARVTKREDTIDFNLTMERITREEAIAQLEALAKTRGITTQTRRDILRKIQALKNEGKKDTTAFNLGIGDIKLPTVYDVRRGIAQVQAQTRAAPAMSGGDVAGLRAANVTANVQVIVNDPNAAGEVYGAIDRALRTGVRSRMRNAGVR